MFDMLFYAEQLVETLRAVGDFLTTQASYRVPVLNIADMTWHLIDIPLPFSFTPAELLIGGGLVALLGFRLAKFFTDLVL